MEEISIFETQHLKDGLGGIADVARQAETALGSLENKLLSLRLNFGKLRAAIERAFAPITSHVASALNGIVRDLTGFVNDAGAVIAALFGTVQEKAVVTAGKTGKALRRSLADFDEIDRLNPGSGGSAGGEVTWKTVSQPLTPQLQRTVDAIRGILAPLEAISFAGAKEALQALGGAIADLGKTVGQSLGWAYSNVLVPLAKWTIEAGVPGAVNALSAAFGLLKAALEPVLAGLAGLLPAFSPLVSFLGSTASLALTTLKHLLDNLTAAFTNSGSGITQALGLIGTAFGSLLQKVTPIFAAIRDSWAAVLGGFGSALATTVQGILTALTGVTDFLAGVFTGNWKRAWEGVRTVFKGLVNGLIGLINGMLSALVGGVNAAVKQLNRFQVQLPAWLPAYGGKSFGFRLPTLTVPQIPYLAKGAVLPANAPFLAVVGDQKHGTNIEAPLGVIQEAVASVLLPGQNEANALLAQLLGAVSGIRVGDETIGRAARRYEKQLLQMGGY